jgi:fido (protein-threonine AMPylation protein)
LQHFGLNPLGKTKHVNGAVHACFRRLHRIVLVVDEDPYCYPGTTVLKNRAGHRTQRALTQFETAMSAQRADEA